MDPNFIEAEEHHRAESRRFSLREFRRIVVLAGPFKRTLIVGLVATVIFAVLHTVSIAGAFPVLKTLLEQEGLRVWAYRAIAGERLGLSFAALENPDDSTILVLRADETGALAGEDITPPALIRAADNRSAVELLHELATCEGGCVVRLTIMPARGDTGDVPRTLTVTPGALTTKTRLLRWAVSLLPADAETRDGKLHLLMMILAGLVVLVVSANVFRFIGEVLIARAVLQTMMLLRTRLYDHTLRLPLSYFASQPTADLVTRFVQDIQEVQRGLMTLFGKFIREPLRAVFILGLAFVLDWRITLTMVVLVPIIVFLFLAIGRSVKKANRKLLKAYGAMIGALTASLQNLRVVKAYTAEAHEQARLKSVDRTVLRQQLKLARLQAFTSPLMETLAIVAGSVGLVWLAGRVLDQTLSMIKFVQLGLTLSVLFDPLRKLSDVYVRLQRSTAGAERIFQVLDHPIEGALSDDVVSVRPLCKQIEYVNVSYTYPGADRPALSDVNLTIRQGEVVAIVGPNGCGKTTLISMLPRFFDPDVGGIRYDGVDIRRASLASLRAQISLVSQEAIVFAGTPAENISYGRAAPEIAAVKDAARQASADAFIERIPGGYEAALGERGTTLSGGQRQRIAIARAVFRNAPVLVFDEATSQIDTESEQEIQSALKVLAVDRTTLIVAHRLSTIQFAARIIVMDAGRVIDTGSHAELYDRCDLYRTLCQTQFAGA